MSNLNGAGQEYVPSQSGYTIEELIDIIQLELTVGTALPKTLADADIRRIIETRAMPWFYKHWFYAVQKMYYLIRKDAFFTEEFTRYNYVNVPCEIQSVVHLYEVKDVSLYQLGINSPNLSVNMGVTNQPYLSSYVTTIGELGLYKTVLDSMSDMLDQLNKYTLKYSFNYLQNRLHILTNVESHVVMEVYSNIPAQYLFREEMFIKYVAAYSKVQLGNMVGRYDFNLPGGFKIQANDLISQGQSEIKEVEEAAKDEGGATSFFVMVKK